MLIRNTAHHFRKPFSRGNVVWFCTFSV